jgi:hypothetical protein
MKISEDGKTYMLIDQQDQYCENDYIAHSNLYVQCNLKFHIESQKTSNSQSNLKPKD